MGLDRWKIGRILGLGALIVGGGEKIIPHADAREVASFTKRNASKEKQPTSLDDSGFEMNLQQNHVARKAVEQYRDYLRAHVDNLEKVRNERNENTMRWYALVNHVATGRSAARVERARYLLSRIKMHIGHLELTPMADETQYKKIYQQNWRILNWTNNDCKELFEMNDDVRDAAYAYFISEKGW